jgi:hypothetical protein
MDGIHHQGQDRVDEGTSLFGVQLFRQGGEVGRVTEEGGDGFALALGGASRFQGGPYGSNLLGEVFRSVGYWRLGTGELGTCNWRSGL